MTDETGGRSIFQLRMLNNAQRVSKIKFYLPVPYKASTSSAASSKAEDAKRVSGYVTSVVFRANEYLYETYMYGTQIFVSITS